MTTFEGRYTDRIEEAVGAVTSPAAVTASQSISLSSLCQLSSFNFEETKIFCFLLSLEATERERSWREGVHIEGGGRIDAQVASLLPETTSGAD